MNKELRLIYLKNLKTQYLKGNLTKKEYDLARAEIRPKKEKKTFIQKIKNLF